jgi:ADP-dependent NAD(P)H-hydrate dehydratase / NAD(P)H-hydrate epimerase
MPTAPAAIVELYTAAQCRELDRLAVEQLGISGFELMQRAGRAAFYTLLQTWPEARSLAVYCGKGNNAGDGYVIAGLARRLGMTVHVVQVGDAAALAGDAARARDWAASLGVHPAAALPDGADADVVVDALLGTGLRGPLGGAFAEAAAAINASGVPVLAVDIPSGVHADTGAAAAGAVRASVTITFIGRKLGLHTGPGVSFRGTLVHDALGVPAAAFRAVAGCPWWHYPDLPAGYRLPERDANAYKHALGHVVVVGGDLPMGGAVLMAAEAALRCGAGMVSVLTRAAHRPAVLARRPELMVVDADDAEARAALLGRADVLVAGPGLGLAAWGEALLAEALTRPVPTLLDADGLTLLARHGFAARGPLVVTPHVGEAARLLDVSRADVQNDRPAAALALARRVAGVAVLKGAGSVVAGHDPGAPEGAVLLGVCAHGNPGMASAGMGDVLSGIIGALLAQGLDPRAAAVSGTCLHGLAGDRAAARTGQRSLIATDLVAAMVALLAEQPDA